MRLEELGERGRLGPGLSIRAAGLADCDVIAAIRNESILIGDATADTEPLDGELYAAHIRGFGPREGYLLLCAEPGGGVDLPAEYQGVISWGVIKKWSERPGYHWTCETSIYLWRGLTGRGYGGMLMRALLERCHAWGYHHLVARANAINTASIRLYENFCHEVIGVQREVTYVHGRWLDGVFMQCILDDVQPDSRVS